MLLNRAMDQEAIGLNVAAPIEAPKAKRTSIRVLTPAELAAVVRELPERWRAFALLGAYSSLRWSELMAVKRDDIDVENRTLQVDEKVVEVGGRFEWGPPKTVGSKRVVDLPAFVTPPLAEHLLRFPPLHGTEDPNLEGLVFYVEHLGPVRRHVFRPAWDRAWAVVGIEGVRPERLRHTGASLATSPGRTSRTSSSASVTPRRGWSTRCR